MIRSLSATLLALLSLQTFAAPAQKPGPVQQISPAFKPCCGEEVPMAFDGTSYAVFWHSGTAITGQRLDASGVRVGVPVPISESATTSVRRAASDGNRFLVVGERDAFSPRPVIDAYPLASDLAIAGPRVEFAGGRPLDLIFNGVEYVLVSSRYDDANQRGELWLSRLSRDGHPIEEKRVAFTSFSATASIAWNGIDYVIAWGDGSLYVSSFDSRLHATGFNARPLSTGFSPTVVWTGSSFVLVWSDLSRLLSARLDPSNPMPLTINAPYEPPPARMVAVMGADADWNGRTITVGFEAILDDAGLYTLQLDESGRAVDTPFYQLSRPRAPTVLGRSDGSALLTYFEGLLPPRFEYAIFSSIVSSGGSPRMRRAVRR